MVVMHMTAIIILLTLLLSAHPLMDMITLLTRLASGRHRVDIIIITAQGLETVIAANMKKRRTSLSSVSELPALVSSSAPSFGTTLHEIYHTEERASQRTAVVTSAENCNICARNSVNFFCFH